MTRAPEIRYDVGDVIEYCTPRGELRQIRVEEKYDDVAPEKPGFTGKDPDDGSEWWGYDSQIIRVVKKAGDAYDVGDVIEYRAFDGELRQIRVEEKDDDVKRGRPGFTGVNLDGREYSWGYDSQIVRVVRRAGR